MVPLISWSGPASFHSQVLHPIPYPQRRMCIQYSMHIRVHAASTGARRDLPDATIHTTRHIHAYIHIHPSRRFALSPFFCTVSVHMGLPPSPTCRKTEPWDCRCTYVSHKPSHQFTTATRTRTPTPSQPSAPPLYTRMTRSPATRPRAGRSFCFTSRDFFRTCRHRHNIFCIIVPPSSHPQRRYRCNK